MPILYVVGLGAKLAPAGFAARRQVGA
jgi:hypothetical protein